MPSKGTTSTKWYNLSGVLEGETADSLDLTNRQEENAYYAVVTHDRNNNEKSTTSGQYYVTKSPKAPEFKQAPTANEYAYANTAVSIEMKALEEEVTFLQNTGLEETIVVKWYQRPTGPDIVNDPTGLEPLQTDKLKFGDSMVVPFIIPNSDTNDSIFVTATIVRNGAESATIISEGSWGISQKKE